LKHTIMGVRDGEDFASYEKTLPILSDDLAVLMGWESREDYVYDYKLTKNQISAIEQACSISFPNDLTLFLTSSES
jgi:hypothetical protein